IDSEYIEGVGKLEGRLVILLDIDKVLSVSEKVAIHGISSSAVNSEANSTHTVHV
ncbi:MAG: hypothetical protein HY880_07475, partial [Deltaproteobacteria bacterium]|nr:hypothetical protein [Deltaproteobacteria bacterium]